MRCRTRDTIKLGARVMKICYLKSDSIHNVLYVIRPEITEDTYKRLVAEFKAVPGGEYEKLVHRIVKLILFCGENLTKLYREFFDMEYDSFFDFLILEQGLDEHLVESILQSNRDDECLWKIDVSDYETYNFMHIFDGQTWEEEPIVNKINLAIARCENENR